MKGQLVHVLRHTWDADCTNRGISSTHTQFTLIGDGVAELFSPSDRAPALRLVKRLTFSGKPYYHAEPFEHPTGMLGPMAGGNYLTTTDSRFPVDHPIPIHDRYETPEQYRSLSL